MSAAARTVRRWDPVELEVSDTAAEVTFTHAERWAVAEPVTVGRRRLVRFAPDHTGPWQYTVRDTGDRELETGTIECLPPADGDAGPVRVQGTRFVHADGAAHHPLGTTSSWWYSQDPQTRAGTLATLARSPFSAVRMSVLAPGATSWPEPDQLDELESAVLALRDAGFQAELVLFGGAGLLPGHPGWVEHLRQVVNRFAGYRNIWWCLALDADHTDVPEHTWDETLRLLAETDHGRRPRTMHAGPRFDFGRRLLSHCSVRDDAQEVAIDPAQAHAKPVLLDVGTEGDLPTPTGGRTAEDVVSLAWWAVCRGGYPWHTEEFARHSWARHGGSLDGDAAPRLAFLAEVLASAPADLTRDAAESKTFTISRPGRYYLQYHGLHRYSTLRFTLPDDADFAVEVLDTWNQTVQQLPGTYSGEVALELPRRPYLAIRMQRC